MNLLPYVALTVLGTIGMVAALRPWYAELVKVVEWEHNAGRAATLRQRRKMIFWAVPVIVFGIVGLIGDVGLIVYWIRTMLS